MATCTHATGPSDGLARVLRQNKDYAERLMETNPQVFESMCAGQHPDYLWLGCADSRVLANEVTGLGPGELFVHRNVGNLVQHTDLNCMSALEYAVQELKVKHIIVCGHYGCGAVKAALKLPSSTLSQVNCWISSIRDTRNRHTSELELLADPQLQHDRLCELNVARQCYNVCTSPVVQNAWARGQQLAVHGLIYRLSDGLLKPLLAPITCLSEATSPTPAPAASPAPPPTPTPLPPLSRISPGRAALNFSFVTPALRPTIDAAVAAPPSPTPKPSPPHPSSDNDDTSPRDTYPATALTLTPAAPTSATPAAAGGKGGKKKAHGGAMGAVKEELHMGLHGLAGLAHNLKAALSLHARYDAMAGGAH